jgi:hypothetical protein
MLKMKPAIAVGFLISMFCSTASAQGPGTTKDLYGHWSRNHADQARGPAGQTGAGRWAGANEHGEEFVSPNVGKLDFHDAVAGMKSARQRALLIAGNEIDRRLGLHGMSKSVVGAWSDGAENSVMTQTTGDDFEHLRVAAAMKGYLADQKAVLAFDENPRGNAWLYTFKAKGSLEDIHHMLLNDGLHFHTLEPASGGAIVHIVDMEGTAQGAVAKAAQSYGSRVIARRGDTAFIGTTMEYGTDAEQRADAKLAYGRLIESSGVRRAKAIWQAISSGDAKPSMATVFRRAARQ